MKRTTHQRHGATRSHHATRRAVVAACVAVALASLTMLGGCGRAKVAQRDKLANGPLRSVLVYTSDDSAATSTSSYLRELGNANGFAVTITSAPGLFAPGYLAEHQVVVINNAEQFGSRLSDEQKAALITWFESGGGIVALHAAAEHDGAWDWWADLLGANYESNSDKEWAELIVDKDAHGHPALIGRGVKLTGDKLRMEHTWPNFDKSVTGRENTQVLVRINEASYDPVNDYHEKRGGQPMGEDHPVSWVVTRGDGRLFYTALGYDVDTLTGMFGSRHIVAGIRWAARTE